MLNSLRQVCRSVMLLLSVVSWLWTDSSGSLKNVLEEAGDPTGVLSSQNPLVSLTPIGNVEDLISCVSRC